MEVKEIFDKWMKILRLENSWDIKLDLVNDVNFKKTGDFKIDPDDRKAILLLNELNPRQENYEEVIVHELLHLKMYPLDQLTEGLIYGHYEQGTGEFSTVYNQFMTNLEVTVEELTKCFLKLYGENRAFSFGRCKEMPSYDELFKGLKKL